LSRADGVMPLVGAGDKADAWARMAIFGEFEPYSLGEGEWQLSGPADIRKNMESRAELALSSHSRNVRDFVPRDGGFAWMA
jgi:hypothetical protein